MKGNDNGKISKGNIRKDVYLESCKLQLCSLDDSFVNVHIVIQPSVKTMSNYQETEKKNIKEEMFE